MAIPGFQTFMLPLLRLYTDRKNHSNQETIEELAEQFNLTDEEKRTLLPSGNQPIFANRIGWARTYLKKAGLIDTASRGSYVITEQGIELLEKNLTEISINYLKNNYKRLLEFRTISHIKEKPNEVEPELKRTPKELLGYASQLLASELAEELLSQIQRQPPRTFEKIVLDLLREMGYGAPSEDSILHTGKSGDEGIDGIIKEDNLGLDVIYVQAKRWTGTVGRPEIHKFVGALQGKAKKGVFLTTSEFSPDAITYAKELAEPKIILIDGKRLTELMVKYNVGVSKDTIYETKKIDSDYFTEE